MDRPFLTPELPGIGGEIKEAFDDFRVDEIPAYPFSGSGEHLIVLVQKRGITTLEAIRRLARHARVPERDVGYAGLKDARGVTTQYLSFGRTPPQRLEGVELPGVRVLETVRHGNKLRLGHLAGNRFTVLIRNPSGGAEDARRILSVLERRGIPNYFGEQRYGLRGNSGVIGRLIVTGRCREAVDVLMGSPDGVDHDGWRSALAAWNDGRLADACTLFPPFCGTERRVVRALMEHPGDHGRALHSIDRRLLTLFLSAAQSELFDAVVARRISAGCFDRPMHGDIALLHRNGACFRVTDPEGEESRFDSLEISPTAPLFGEKMMLPEKDALSLEREVAREMGVSLDQRVSFGTIRLPGERRAIRIPLRGVSVQGGEEGVTVSFVLPRGGYATTLLRELMKGDVYNVTPGATISG